MHAACMRFFAWCLVLCYVEQHNGLAHMYVVKTNNMIKMLVTCR